MRTAIIILMLCISVCSVAQNEEPDTVRTQMLDEVVVQGEKPQVIGRDGKMIVDLPEIVRDKPVTNILEALSFLPGVVNNNGMIGLAGVSGTTIILNGEYTNMPVDNLYQLLYSMPIDRLKNVEVMYAAPAKYHVDGAVINIVLNTPKPLDGLQGQTRVGFMQSHYASYGAALSATYAVKDWTFDFNYSLTRSHVRNKEQTRSNHLYQGVRVVVEDIQKRISESLPNTVFAQTGYNFSEKSNIKLTYNGQINSDIKARSITSGNLNDYLNLFDYHSPIGYHNLAVCYISSFGMTAGGDYTDYSEHRTQHLFPLPSSVETVIYTNRQRINRYHVYVDQEHDIKNWMLSYGAEYQHSDDCSRQEYELPLQAGFRGTNREDVANVYIGIQRNFNMGLSFNTSIKGEYYHNNYDSSWNFIPQLGVTYYRTPKSIFQLNFISERAYPSYWELREGISYLNDYSEVIGNPLLKPYMEYSGQLSYIFKQKYVATFYAQYGDNATVQLPYQSPNELKLIYQTINMNYKRIVGLNLHVPFNVGFIWNATATANIFNQREKADRFHDIGFDNKKWVFYGALNNSFRFSQNSPVSLSVDFTYISSSLQGIADLTSIWKIDAGVKWQFGKKRCCEFDLKADDIFNKWSPTMKINQSGQDYHMKVNDMTRNFKLTFIWRFNGFKPQDHNIDTSRFGTGK